MNLEIDSIELKILYGYNDECIVGDLRITIRSKSISVLKVYFKVSEYNDLKEICREDGNTIKYIKNRMLSELANFKIANDIKEIPIIDTEDIEFKVG